MILTTSSTEGDMCFLLQKCVRYFVQICESLNVRLVGVQIFVVNLETIICYVFGSVNWFVQSVQFLQRILMHFVL